MVKGRQILLLVVLMLVAAALACAPSFSGQTPVLPAGATQPAGGQAPAPAGDQAPAPAGGTGDEDAPLTSASIDTSTLSSYRWDFTMSWSGTDDSGAAVNGTFTINEAYSTNPPASHTKWEAQGTDTSLGAGGFETIQIGEVTYMLTSGAGAEPECLTFSEQGSVPQQSPPFSPDSFWSGADFSRAQRVLPNENVNGVMTRHYRFTQTEGVLLATGFSSYTGDVWVAVDGGYPVRETLAADGTLVGFGTGQGHVEWTYDLLDINGPVDIQPPAGCEAPAGSDFPKMADATEVSSFGGLLTYSTATPMADVVAFYQGQLPGLGWTAGATSTDVPGLATLEFTRGEEKVSITISESEGKTSVLASFE